MSVKKIAAIIIASLVAGVVLGSFGIAGAGSNTAKLPGAMAPVPASMADNCGDCSMEASGPAAAPMEGCPGNGGAGAGECGGSGECAQ